MNDVTDHDSELRLLRSAETRASELARLFSAYRDRLERMLEFRIDRRLRGRIDTADILQEAFIVINERLSDFLAAPQVSLFVWFRKLTLQCMIDQHRRHFRDKRSVGKEIKLTEYDAEGATSMSIAQAIVDPLLSPSKAVARAEELEQLRQALDGMDEIDREVLALRHFEHLNNKETAEALGLSTTAASNRYVRAMARLSSLMQTLTKS